ncbi:MAG: trimethylamine methyltransferase family protein [Fidelibacterota bacterium]|nr:MAG: trimethylamine methyltransferase family protein [Candidatus Neomarinimicrobiota bacterium]
MRPRLQLLEDGLIQRIVDEAVSLLGTLGVEVQNEAVLSLLADHGARIDLGSQRAFFQEGLIQTCLERAPSAFKLYDVPGNETNDFCGNKVHYTPGSAALNVLDYETKRIRKPVTADYITYAKIMSQLEHIASQSTAFIPSDVHENISDSYRLFLSLLYCEKPVVTGAFTIESFAIMKDLQMAVRGSEEALKEKPLTVFSCCPTSPLKWSGVTSQNVVDCAQYAIPVEFISMPLAGFIAPVTLTGSLIQHTAETLSGIVISQTANPGTPVLYGGSPAIFDVRFETTPMGAVETMMIDCAYNEIGKHLGLPTQAYISLSDAKQLDAQAGLESSMGATLAALSGINNISGSGMLDFESCISLEKLVLDNEICGMTFRLLEGIEPREDFPALPHFQELLKEGYLIIAEHTRKYLREEHLFPGPSIDRANRPRWEQEGSTTLEERAHREIEKYLEGYQPSRIDGDAARELVGLMEGEARRHGMDQLPEREA